MIGYSFIAQYRREYRTLHRFICRLRVVFNLEKNKERDTRFHTLLRSCFLGTLIILMSTFATGCKTESKETRLRVINDSTIPIENLIVIFPKDQIQFGNIAPGATTDYIDVPNGIYRYAAYKFDLGGNTITQPVIDWVGETPMEGTSFTYTINIDPDRDDGQIIQLTEVTED